MCDCVHTQAVTVTRRKWSEPLQTSQMHVHAPGPIWQCSHTRTVTRPLRRPSASCDAVCDCVACKFTHAHRHAHLALAVLRGLCTQTRSPTRTVTQSQYTLCMTVCVTVLLSQRTLPSCVGGVSVNAQSHIVVQGHSLAVCDCATVLLTVSLWPTRTVKHPRLVLTVWPF